VFGADGKTAPHGGVLVNRMLDTKAAAAKIAACNTAIDITERQSCDVEMLNVGGFSPLEGYMNEDVYTHCVENMRLPGSNLLFGLPVVFDTNRDDLKPGMSVALNHNGQTLGVLDIESRWKPNKPLETKKCYGTSSLEHPGTQYVAFDRAHHYIGGTLSGISMPNRPYPCATPAEVRASLPANSDVVAFQCRNPVHRAHYELFMRSLDAENVLETGVVLVHPTMGPTQADDISGIVRYETYKVLQEETNKNARVKWAFLPYSMHMAGPREAIQHMMIRKNYGCTHFIIGRDMAGSKSSLDGEDFYGAYDAQDMAKLHSAELGMQTVPSLNLVYTAEKGYVTADHAKESGISPLTLSGTKFRKALRAGEDIPEWFAFKSVVEVLRKYQ
jgi:sulfate adenylyltransferase